MFVLLYYRIIVIITTIIIHLFTVILFKVYFELHIVLYILHGNGLLNNKGNNI